MVVLNSLVYGGLQRDSSEPLFLKKKAQRFVREEVFVSPSRDRYLDVTRAKEIILSGKSLAVESGAFGRKPAKVQR